jgi:hypothetical protein
MKTPNHPATIYQDIVTAALPGLCGHHGSDNSGQPNQLEIRLQAISVSPPETVCDSGRGENRQHNEVHILNRLRMVLEPKKCGNRDRERQRSEANYEKHGCRLLAGLRGDPDKAA